MALAADFESIIDSLPDDWTDLSLDLRLADSGKHGLWALLGAAITSDLYRSKRYVEQTPDEVTVRVSGDTGMLATDGEVQPAPPEVTFRVRRQALTVFCGRHSAS